MQSEGEKTGGEKFGACGKKGGERGATRKDFFRVRDGEFTNQRLILSIMGDDGTLGVETEQKMYICDSAPKEGWVVSTAEETEEGRRGGGGKSRTARFCSWQTAGASDRFALNESSEPWKMRAAGHTQ